MQQVVRMQQQLLEMQNNLFQSMIMKSSTVQGMPPQAMPPMPPQSMPPQAMAPHAMPQNLPSGNSVPFLCRALWPGMTAPPSTEVPAQPVQPPGGTEHLVAKQSVTATAPSGGQVPAPPGDPTTMEGYERTGTVAPLNANQPPSKTTEAPAGAPARAGTSSTAPNAEGNLSLDEISDILFTGEFSAGEWQ